MTDPISDELREDLRAATLGEGGACDYHARPKVIDSDEMLIEAIRIIDHPQLDEYPDHWVIDAARCDNHAVDEIVEPTRGFEETLIQVPVTVSNGVVSVSTDESDDLPVLAFSPATEGLHPMTIDQQLMTATEPNDHGLSRWTRVIGMLDAEPPETLREHIQALIEESPETPPSV